MSRCDGWPLGTTLDVSPFPVDAITRMLDDGTWHAVETFVPRNAAGKGFRPSPQLPPKA
jgi:hypothetical protein